MPCFFKGQSWWHGHGDIHTMGMGDMVGPQQNVSAAHFRLSWVGVPGGRPLHPRCSARPSAMHVAAGCIGAEYPGMLTWERRPKKHWGSVGSVCFRILTPGAQCVAGCLVVLRDPPSPLLALICHSLHGWQPLHRPPVPGPLRRGGCRWKFHEACGAAQATALVCLSQGRGGCQGDETPLLWEAEKWCPMPWGASHRCPYGWCM